jgi:hypothetical protein
MDVVINIFSSPSPIISNYFSPRVYHTSNNVHTIRELDEIVLTEKEHTIVDLSGYLVQENIQSHNKSSTVLSFMKDLNDQKRQIEQTQIELDIDMIDFEEIKKEFDDLLTQMSIEEIDKFLETLETLEKI